MQRCSKKTTLRHLSRILTTSNVGGKVGLLAKDTPPLKDAFDLRIAEASGRESSPAKGRCNTRRFTRKLALRGLQGY